MGSGNSKENDTSEPKTHYPYSGNRPVADPCQLTRRALEDCLYGDGSAEACKALIDAHRMLPSSSRNRPSLQSSTDSTASKNENVPKKKKIRRRRAKKSNNGALPRRSPRLVARGGRAPFNSTSFLIQDAQEREASPEKKMAGRTPLMRRASKTRTHIERDVKDEIERMDLDHFVALEKETEIAQTAGKTRDELISLLINTKMKYQKTLEDLEKIQQENHHLKTMLFPDL